MSSECYLMRSLSTGESDQLSLTPRLQLHDYREPFPSITNALTGFPPVELDLRISSIFLRSSGADSDPFFSSISSLKTLRLRFYDFHHDTTGAATRVLHTFLKSCPELHTLSLTTNEDVPLLGRSTPAVNLLPMAFTGENKLDFGAPPLRTVELTGSG